jgi:hypothetical protein
MFMEREGSSRLYKDLIGLDSRHLFVVAVGEEEDRRRPIDDDE